MTNSVVYAGRNRSVTTCILENEDHKLFIRILPSFRGHIRVSEDQQTVTFDCDGPSLETLITALEDCLDSRRLDERRAQQTQRGSP